MLTCLQVARDELHPRGMLRYAIDAVFVNTSYAAVFLLKLLRPELEELVDKAAVRREVDGWVDGAKQWSEATLRSDMASARGMVLLMLCFFFCSFHSFRSCCIPSASLAPSASFTSFPASSASPYRLVGAFEVRCERIWLCCADFSVSCPAPRSPRSSPRVGVRCRCRAYPRAVCWIPARSGARRF